MDTNIGIVAVLKKKTMVKQFKLILYWLAGSYQKTKMFSESEWVELVKAHTSSNDCRITERLYEMWTFLFFQRKGAQGFSVNNGVRDRD